MAKKMKAVFIGKGIDQKILDQITSLIPEGSEIVIIDVEALKQENFQLSKLKDDYVKVIKEKDELIEKQMENIAELEKGSDTSELTASIENLTEEARQKDELIESLMENQQSNDASRKEGAPVIAHAGKKYKLTIPKFEFRGKIVTEEVLRSDKKLVKELVGIKSGALQLID